MSILVPTTTTTAPAARSAHKPATNSATTTSRTSKETIATHLQSKSLRLETINIISSTKINKKVSQILRLLEPTTNAAFEKLERVQKAGSSAAGDGKARNPIVAVTAKARVAGKAISVVEIVKREVKTKEWGPLFQYTVVEGVIEEFKERAHKHAVQRRGSESTAPKDIMQKSKNGDNKSGNNSGIQNQDVEGSSMTSKRKRKRGTIPSSSAESTTHPPPNKRIRGEQGQDEEPMKQKQLLQPVVENDKQHVDSTPQPQHPPDDTESSPAEPLETTQIIPGITLPLLPTHTTPKASEHTDKTSDATTSEKSTNKAQQEEGEEGEVEEEGKGTDQDTNDKPTDNNDMELDETKTEDAEKSEENENENEHDTHKSDDSDTYFETLHPPSDGDAVRSKIREIPIMTIYLSRTHIPYLQEVYGEQEL